MRRVFALLLLAVILAASAVRAEEMTFKPAFPASPLKGPAAATGAVIWSHGANSFYGITDVTASPPAAYVSLLRNQGWDIFRLDRPSAAEEVRRSTNTLLQHTEDLKRQGYRKVVLAGQSAGAWISIIVAGKTDAVYAVIANAPAYRGVDWPKKERNASELFENLETAKRGRIMLSFFANDPFDPGGRGPKTDAILAKSAVPHLVIDTPEGFSGHGAGSGSNFARHFGRCALAMVGDGPVPARAACEDVEPGRVPSANFVIPPDLHLAAAQGDSTPIDEYLGKWYGIYRNGREFMLAIEEVNGDKVTAAYLSSAPDSGQSPPSHRMGRLSGDALFSWKRARPRSPTSSARMAISTRAGKR